MFIGSTLSQTDLLGMPPAHLSAIRTACLRDLQSYEPNRASDQAQYRESKSMLLKIDAMLGF
ncbi:hypothetical protein GRI38_10695 [Altererythrobacter aurantiacus]|uniref:Uncharacterized protein n=1 Tax=Parapontixanthobacter aurantiacus TaxID=1463599 RepID=A0A844ZGW7_9SPHN|nr:hypothetical protein [Parapontixanthobacter aurantiacus]MXO86492.1 hypothetical protein [Parapontixanthobacter aurantiacus]